MHILIIPSAYPTEDAPLRSSFFKEQAIALKESGNDVGVIYSETRRLTKINFTSLKKNHFQITNQKENGINTFRLHGWNILMMRNRLGIALWIRQSLFLFNKYIKKYGIPDVIHVHCALYGGKVAELIKKKYNIPYVVTEHSSLVMNGLVNNYQRKLIKSAYDNANALISVGNRLKDAMSRYTDGYIYVVPNIVDTTLFFYKNKNRKDKFVFVSVCILTKNKNVDLTIKAFANKFKGHSKFKLLIIGDGVEKKNLQFLSKELEVDEQVEFVGNVGRENVPKYLQSADVFVLPSKYETFGVAYIEALACGLPIITTSCGGPEDFYNESLGYMIPTNDLEKLSVVMENSVDNIEKFNCEEISKYIKSRFSKKVITVELEKVYKSVLERNIY